MIRAALLAACLLATTDAGLRADELPLHPDDRRALARVLMRAGLDAPPEINPPGGWPRFGGEPCLRFRAVAEPTRVLAVAHDAEGRITRLVGNGPLVPNEAWAWLAELPRLESVRVDHNTPPRGSDESLETYDGAGLAALADAPLKELKIGHAFDDDGMAALARVRELRSAAIVHSRATDAGVAHLAGHPSLEEFSISPQARPTRVTDRALASLAALPRLRRLGLHETFLTYDGGLKHLAPLRGRLEWVSFKLALVLPADLERFRADHPGLEIETSTPAEILAAPNARGVLKWASPEARAYLEAAAPRDE